MLKLTRGEGRNHIIITFKYLLRFNLDRGAYFPLSTDSSSIKNILEKWISSDPHITEAKPVT